MSEKGDVKMLIDKERIEKEYEAYREGLDDEAEESECYEAVLEAEARLKGSRGKGTKAGKKTANVSPGGSRADKGGRT